jgi:hypothetical protein
MTVGIGLTNPQFKSVLKELRPEYKQDLLKIYTLYAKILGNLPRGVKIGNR